MTNQEAIERIERHMIIHATKEPHAVYITEALNMAIEALKKREPLKPTNPLLGLYRCGDCGSEVDWWSSEHFCPRCGRAVKWE